MASIDALTLRQRWILAAATIAGAASRLLSLPRTPWDWDELLFMHAVNRYNVALHNPHPPGFPLYIFAAKIIRKLGFGNFHALQAMSVAAGMLIVPAMFFLCRALKMRFSTSISAALILAFFPNVWFYGGAALSDVPSMVLVIVAVALLLRGNLLLGAVVLGVAAGFRPQNLVIGFAPLLLAAWREKRRAVVAAAILAVIVGVSYGSAAWLTGLSAYRTAVREHSAYINAVDSFRATRRLPLWRLFDDFFIQPYHAPWINALVTLFAAVSVVASAVLRRRHVILALAAFGPFCLMALLFLDHFSVSRFSIGYAPLIALLAADGIFLLARRIEPVAAAVLVVMMIVWTWPALAAVRHTIAPPVAAVDWIRNHVDPRSAVIYVDEGVIPYANWYLPEYRRTNLYDSTPPALWRQQPGLYVREGASNTSGAQNFIRPQGRLWDLVRQRYFEASVSPIAERVVFGEGWHEEESERGEVWRWMAGRSVAQLPPLAGDARLTLTLYVPTDALPAAPKVTIRVNGEVVDRFEGSSALMQRELVVHARGDAPNELVIETDRVVTPPPGDPRLLGLRLNALGWDGVRASRPQASGVPPGAHATG
jgi:hypothetical protein